MHSQNFPNAVGTLEPVSMSKAWTVKAKIRDNNKSVRPAADAAITKQQSYGRCETLKIIFQSSFILLALIIISCSEDTDSLNKIQEQQVGDYNVSVWSYGNGIRQGASKFYIEFRTADDNRLVDVDNLKINSMMHMMGATMNSETNFKMSELHGRYEVNCSFSMLGNWMLEVSFGDDLAVNFTLVVT